MRRLPSVLVSLSLALGGVAVAQPASAASPAKTACAPQAKRVTAAKRELAKAKTPKVKRAAKKQLATSKRALAACKAKAVKKPAPAPAAPAPAPAPPAPAPAPAPVPAAPIALLPAAPTAVDGLTFAVAAREVAPAGSHYQLVVSASSGASTPGCGLRTNQSVGDLSTGATVTFVPQQAKAPAGGATAWCVGRWVAALVLVADAPTTGPVGGPVKAVATLPFVIAP
jgi:hypothetical protein